MQRSCRRRPCVGSDHPTHMLSLPPFPETGREAHREMENATGGGWHLFLLQTHSPLQRLVQFTYECCGVLHKQELREQKGAESERKGKGKKDKTGTGGGDRHPEARLQLRVIQRCPCCHALQGHKCRKRYLPMLCPCPAWPPDPFCPDF